MGSESQRWGKPEVAFPSTLTTGVTCFLSPVHSNLKQLNLFSLCTSSQPDNAYDVGVAIRHDAGRTDEEIERHKSDEELALPRGRVCGTVMALIDDDIVR